MKDKSPISPVSYKVILFSFILAVSWLSQVQAQVYPAPAGLQASVAYRVQVDGKEAFVYASPVPAAFCSFNFEKPVEIVIKANRDVKWVDIRPLSAGVKATFRDSTIRLRITKPQQLTIELNGSLRTPLFLFANAPEKARPPKNDPDIRYFEGGKVYYPGVIELESNQALYIEGGAVVVGVVKARGAKNIKVHGYGILDGTYNNRLDDSMMQSKSFDTSLLRNMKGTYHNFLEFIDCQDVSIEGVTLSNSTSWQVVPVNCTNVTINNVKIISDQASDDGIDIVRSRKVNINNCFIRTKDDCVAIKAHLDYPSSVAVDDVLVQNSTFWNALWGNAIEIGFELNAAEIKNIIFRNIDIIHVESGAALSIHNAGTGHVKNVVFEDIRIEDARHKLFDFAIFRSQYSEDRPGDQEERARLYLNGAWDGVLMVPADKKSFHAKYRGQVSDVVLRNIEIVDGLFPFSIFYGSDPRHKVSNVRVENMKVHGKKITRLEEAKFYLENTASISIK